MIYSPNVRELQVRTHIRGVDVGNHCHGILYGSSSSGGGGGGGGNQMRSGSRLSSITSGGTGTHRLSMSLHKHSPALTRIAYAFNSGDASGKAAMSYIIELLTTRASSNDGALGAELDHPARSCIRPGLITGSE